MSHLLIGQTQITPITDKKHFFVRIHLTKEQLEPAIVSLQGACRQFIAYEHADNPDRIHCHMIISEATVSTDTLKNYISKNCPTAKRGVGNKFWSFKSANDLHGAITYMSKGKYDPFSVKGFTQDEIDSSKDRWVERTPETSKYQTRLQYVVRESPAEAKKRKNDLVKEMIYEINENNVAHNSLEIIKIIIRVLNSNNVVFGRYTVRDYFDTIQGRINTDSYATQMDYFCSYRT